MSRVVATRCVALLALQGALALFGACGPGGQCDSCSSPSTELACVSDPAPVATAPQIVLGRLEGTTFVPLGGGDRRQLDYGDQGGQHFYVTARWYAPPQGGMILLRYDGPNNGGGATVFLEEPCSSWLSADTYVQIDSPEAQTGTLTAQAGTCAPGGCTYDEQTDRYLLDEVLAETAVVLEIVP